MSGQRWVGAVAAVALACLLRWAWSGVLAGTPYLAFYPAVVAAAALGGLGPGLLATVAAALCVDLLFDPTPWWIDWRDPVAMSRLAIFVAGGAGVSVLAQLLRAAHARSVRQGEELIESARRYRTVAEYTYDWEFWLGPDERFLYVSPSCLNVTGYPAADFLTDPDLAHRIVHPKDQARYAEHRGAGGEACRTEELEFRIIRRDGAVRWIAHVCMAVYDEAGAFLGVRGSNRDITERKAAEEALRESETRYRNLFDSIDEGFCIIEVIFDAADKPIDYRFLTVNPSFEKQTGLAGAQGKTMRQLRPKHEAHWFEIYGRIALTGQPARFQNRAEQLGRWYDVYAFRFGPPETHQVAILFNDITERRHMEAAVQESRERLAGIIESAMDAIITVDEQQRVILFNPAAERMFGCPASQALGGPVDRFIPARFREAHSGHIRRFGQTGETARSMGRLGAISGLRISGEEFPIEASISQVLVGERKLFSVILRDITERRRSEESLVAAKISADRAKQAADEARAAAERANQAKDQFLAQLSHELRTPLTPVLGAMSLMEGEKDLPPACREAMVMVKRNIELEARLIDDLLDLTRIERGKLQLDLRPTMICQVIDHVADTCRPDIDGRGLHFGVRIERRPLFVLADSGRLQQVLWNLIKNAVKFTPHGGSVEVRAWAVEGHVLVEVTDSGVGISPEALPHIFNAFEQGGTQITKQFGGLGLGLAISKRLVDLHGGTIEAHSDGPGKGARFRVALRASAPGARLSPPADESQASAMHAGADTRARRGLRILLVEDHGDTARVMIQLLRAEGHAVEHAGDVATALEMALQRPYDLLLSDLGLPDGSGVDLLRQLRQRGQKLPAIALSGYGMEADVAASAAAGFTEHITKPLDLERLTAAIGRAHGGSAENRGSLNRF